MVKIFTISIIALLTMSLSIVGCQAVTQTKEDPARLACIEMMEKVPLPYEDFEFWDVKTLRSDPDLSEMYQVWRERRVDFLEKTYGLEVSSIDYLAEGNGSLEIFKADYDVKALRDKISVDFYCDTSYKNREVWKSELSHDWQSVMGGWVLAEGLLVRGSNNSNVEDYLRVVSGEEPSLYDKEVAALLEKLPSGIEMRIIRETYPEGLIVSGQSFKKEANKTLRWTYVHMYESEAAAGSDEANEIYKSLEEEIENARSEFTRRGEPVPFSDFRLEREGRFVKWSLLVEEKYMIALLFYG